MRIIFILLASFGFASFSFAQEFDNQKFCDEAKKIQKTVIADVGEMLDAYTRNDGMAVLCNSKMIEYKKFLILDEKQLREGWRERKANQWNQIYCEGPFLQAIKNGWTVAFTVVTQDGVRFWHKAECKKE